MKYSCTHVVIVNVCVCSKYIIQTVKSRTSKERLEMHYIIQNDDVVEAVFVVVSIKSKYNMCVDDVSMCVHNDGAFMCV